MTRRELLVAAAAPARAAANNKPNIVFVFADQLRLQSCGYAGDPDAFTPNIDRLAAESANVSQAISNTPVCAPYRASLMTGKCQSSTGMVINELRLSPDHDCLGHALTRGGYRTGYIGKWHLWAAELGGHGKTRNGFVPPGPYRLGFDGLWAGYNFNHSSFHAPYFGNTPEPRTWAGYEADAQTSMACEFIMDKSPAASPFALFLSYGPPHDPWDWNNAPPEFVDRFRDSKIPLRPNFKAAPDPYADAWARIQPDYPKAVVQYLRGYYAQTANIDANLGRIMRAIEAAGQAENTILVFTSDHGEMFGAHGRRAKLIFYEEAIRVPFLLRWPGRIKAGSRSDLLLGTPDIMPMLLGLAGLPVPRGVEGMDVSRSLLGKGGAKPQAQFLQGMGTTAAWRDGTEWRAMRDHRFTYGIYRRDRSELLFDNQKDPYQVRNLAGERPHSARLKHYREALARWMKDQGDTFEACTWYERNWTKDRNILRGAKGGSHDLEHLDRILRLNFPAG